MIFSIHKTVAKRYVYAIFQTLYWATYFLNTLPNNYYRIIHETSDYVFIIRIKIFTFSEVRYFN